MSNDYKQSSVLSIMKQSEISYPIQRARIFNFYHSLVITLTILVFNQTRAIISSRMPDETRKEKGRKEDKRNDD